MQKGEYLLLNLHKADMVKFSTKREINTQKKLAPCHTRSQCSFHIHEPQSLSMETSQVHTHDMRFMFGVQCGKYKRWIHKGQ